MKAITIKYRPILWLNLYLTIRRQVPESWPDVSEKQFRAFESLQLGEIDDLQFIVDFFGIPVRIARQCTYFLRYSLFDMLSFMGDQMQLIDFLFDGRRIKHRLDVTKVKSPVLIMIDKELKKVKYENV